MSSAGLDLESGGYTFGIAYPSGVLDEFMSLDIINMNVQRLGDYLKTAWGLQQYPISPYKDGVGNAYIDVNCTVSSDVLSTSALVFLQGPSTMKGGEYKPTDVMLSEVSREHATAWITTMKQCVGYLAVPRDGSENGKTDLVYEIQGVC